tara:strand:+ start:2784 stop:3737 length:954 start_codon:yes stop_codon:yes gene_type:complete
MEKSHEAYLELVENAVAETTQQLLAEGDTDIRKLTRRLAEKEVEIQRIKGHLVGERAKVKKTQKELQGFYAICDEYLEGTETTRNPEFLGAYIEEKTGQLWEQDEMYSQIEELKEEKEELQKQLEDDTRQVHTLFAENEKLKEQVIASMSETWRSKLAALHAENSAYKAEIEKLKKARRGAKVFEKTYGDLKEENEKLKDCSYDEYCALIAEYPTENKLVKEFEDLKNECGFLEDKCKEWVCYLENQGEELSRAEAKCELKDKRIKWLEAEVQARKNAPTTRSQSQIKGLKKKVEKLEKEIEELKKVAPKPALSLLR